jgi:hypothetical protein
MIIFAKFFELRRSELGASIRLDFVDVDEVVGGRDEMMICGELFDRVDDGRSSFIGQAVDSCVPRVGVDNYDVERKGGRSSKPGSMCGSIV